MTSTLVGYFDNYNEARQTQQDLLQSGLHVNDLEVIAQEGTAATPSDTEKHGMWDRIKAALGFASEEERGYYQEAARHGGALLTVRVPDEETSRVADIIESHHPVDLDRRMEEWGGTGAMGGPMGAPRSTTATGEASIPIAQEELQVGKRAVQRGAVRIHSHIVTEPVEEQVRLREEQAVVERTPVERPVVSGEAAFQERTIEVEEMGEEAVASKQARVTEEISVGKQETERSETVRDTVRKTKVEVERDPKRKP